jgi:hypothetical protein
VRHDAVPAGSSFVQRRSVSECLSRVRQLWLGALRCKARLKDMVVLGSVDCTGLSQCCACMHNTCQEHNAAMSV